MRKVYAICITSVLFLSAGAYATGYMGMGGIGQTEDFSLHGENYVSQVGLHGSAVGGNIGSVDQDQRLMKICNVKLTQSENTLLCQNANASGTCGSFSVFEQADAEGDQNQLISQKKRHDTTAQDESLDVELFQIAEKSGGAGDAGGIQCIISGQDQSIKGGGIKMDESQCIGVAQYADVSGGFWSDAQASNYVTISADQSQTAR